MADNNNQIENQIRGIARHILDLLSNPNTGKFENERLQAQADTLRDLTKGNQDSVESILNAVRTEAPVTFNRMWESTFTATLNYSNNLDGAIDRLGLLLGWAYIESAWNAQVTRMPSEILGGSHLAKLAGIQMGLSEKLSEKNVLTAILTSSNLFSTLLLQRFEKSVVGGLEKIDGMEGRLSDWEKRLDATEGRVNGAEEKISAYQGTLDKYKVAFGFLGMAAAYKDFFRRKKNERLGLLIALGLLFLAILGTPAVAYRFVGLFAVASTTEQQQFYSLFQLAHYIPFAASLFLLIYFFRVVLFHFNSTQAQLIQLELRMAAFGFIQEYVTFLKDNNSPDLSKFEALVFGGIVAELNKVPSTFDGLDQLLKTVMQMKGEKK